MLIFAVNIRPARTFWNSTHSLLSPFTLDWSRNLWHNPMLNMAVNNISHPIYPLSTRTEKGYITKMIPFFFCSVYICHIAKHADVKWIYRLQYTTKNSNGTCPVLNLYLCKGRIKATVDQTPGRVVLSALDSKDCGFDSHCGQGRFFLYWSLGWRSSHLTKQMQMESTMTYS